MMRLMVWFGAFIPLMLGLAAGQAAPLDNRDGFWSDWSDATFARAAAEKKFVIVSLQSWWCPWCHVMNRDTWAKFDMCTGSAIADPNNSLCQTYTSCLANTQVTLCTTTSGGHLAVYGNASASQNPYSRLIAFA